MYYSLEESVSWSKRNLPRLFWFTGGCLPSYIWFLIGPWKCSFSVSLIRWCSPETSGVSVVLKRTLTSVSKLKIMEHFLLIVSQIMQIREKTVLAKNALFGAQLCESLSCWYFNWFFISENQIKGSFPIMNPSLKSIQRFGLILFYLILNVRETDL